MPSCGIIGLPMAGKTTVYNLLTGAKAQTSSFFSGKTEANIGMAKVPDQRVDFLARYYKPKKTTFAQIEFMDMPGLVRGASEGQGIGNAFLESVRRVDALVHVVRAFNESDAEHIEGSVSPLRDVQTLAYELLMADMAFVDKRISRLKEGKKRPPQAEEEIILLEKILFHLESERPLKALELSFSERGALAQYTFLTDKPMILVINLDEHQLRSKVYEGSREIAAYAEEHAWPLIELSAHTEVELAELSIVDRQEFLRDLDIRESGVDRIARAAYDVLGLVSFFTVGEDEVRAWTLRRESTAKQAAGKIHSDLERGFIRAELMRYADFAAWGTPAKLKEKGLFSLEGKDYLVQDGDILSIRFNV
ncbi:MAG: Ribosome-binding ATPase YchF [Firmicutes bacterium]|nr:Ribosome-binding ATPase YchF [Bacillota bacterium]